MPVAHCLLTSLLNILPLHYIYLMPLITSTSFLLKQIDTRRVIRFTILLFILSFFSVCALAADSESGPLPFWWARMLAKTYYLLTWPVLWLLNFMVADLLLSFIAFCANLLLWAFILERMVYFKNQWYMNRLAKKQPADQNT